MSDKTLQQIIDEVRDGGHPDYEDLRYAVCALEHLAVFSRNDLSSVVRRAQSGQNPITGRGLSSEFFQLENIRREQYARARPPKQWVGWNNDPDNPEFLERRKESSKIVEKIVARIKKGKT